MNKYFIIMIFIAFCNFSVAQTAKKETINKTPDVKKPKVTFVELGSVNCIPCKMMQPVMEAIEKKFGNQIEIIFYDVWKQEQKKYAQQYKINLIPTQVFLDSEGKEFHRHEGFYPEAEIIKVLESKGLKQIRK